jgi:hypothetical protein
MLHGRGGASDIPKPGVSTAIERIPRSASAPIAASYVADDSGDWCRISSVGRPAPPASR